MKSVKKISYSGPFSIQTTLPAGGSESYEFSHSIIFEEKEGVTRINEGVERGKEQNGNDDVTL